MGLPYKGRFFRFARFRGFEKTFGKKAPNTINKGFREIR